MFVTDRLSTELNINYMDLFNKVNDYNTRNGKEDVKLNEVFNHNEQTFLACFALEYLKQNGIHSVGMQPDTGLENYRE